MNIILVLALYLCTAVAVPLESELSSKDRLTRRGCEGKFGEKATKYYGDYTGCAASYPDGSGTYVETKDVHHYASGVKCWTDLVSHCTCI